MTFKWRKWTGVGGRGDRKVQRKKIFSRGGDFVPLHLLRKGQSGVYRKLGSKRGKLIRAKLNTSP